MADITITPLHPSIGAEVSGVDLSAPIDEATRDALAARWPSTWPWSSAISR